MIDSSPGRSSVKDRPDDELDELRDLLVGPEQAEIEKIRKKLDSPPSSEQIAKVLPEAITIRSRKDETITRAILPSVETAIHASVKRNPKVLADALFPLMGPAIRKAISAALAGMVQSLNETLEHSLSLPGLKWRLEAYRTKKSFGEIVLLHSLRYRVEQLFLIHKASGLLLQHVTASNLRIQDSDMVSGMLTAIQDFVRDSFGVSKEETLNAMQVGELTVWVEEGPFAILAAVIRGKAPEQLRMIMSHVLENIHAEKGQEIENFDGNTESFESVRYQMESCLVSQYEAKPKRISPVFVAALMLLLSGIGIWSFFLIRDARRWNHYKNALTRQSGIVLVETGKSEGKFFVAGLRDPLAPDPEALLTESGLKREQMISKWEPYQSMSPPFILARARSVLNPPSSVKLDFQDGVLTATGEATHGWVADAEKLAPTIFGVTRWNAEKLQDADLRKLNEQKAVLQQKLFRFQKGTAQLIPGQETSMQDTIASLLRLNDAARNTGLAVRVLILGRADSEGEETTNIQLSRARAEFFRQTLVFRGFPSDHLSIEGVGSSRPLRPESTEQEREFNRSVSFGIDFLPAASKNGGL